MPFVPTQGRASRSSAAHGRRLLTRITLYRPWRTALAVASTCGTAAFIVQQLEYLGGFEGPDQWWGTVFFAVFLDLQTNLTSLSSGARVRSLALSSVTTPAAYLRRGYRVYTQRECGPAIFPQKSSRGAWCCRCRWHRLF